MSLVLSAFLAATLWRPIGPSGGEPPRKIVVHPTVQSTLYAPAARGVLKSTDGGQSWNYAHYRRPDRMFRVAINPVSPNVVVAYGNPGLIRSIDDGATWSVIVTAGVDAIAYSPAGTLLVAFQDGLKRSTDDGTTWTASPSGLPSGRSIPTITFDSRGAGYLAAGGSVYSSSDDGNRWSRTSRDPGSEVVNFLTIGPGDALYASLPGSIRRSTDGGANWSTVPGTLGSGAIVTDISFLANVMYVSYLQGGVFRSSNGTTWQRAGDQSANLQTMSVTAVGSALFTTSTPYGIARSDDGGNTWVPSNRGYSDQDVRALALAEGRLYAGTFDTFGLFATSDFGHSWMTMPTNIASPVMSIAIHPANPRVMYIGTGGAGIITSTDGGATWRSSSVGLTMHAITVDPSNPAVAYAISRGSSMIKTTNGGASWTDISGSFSFNSKLNMSHIAVDPLNPSVVYLAAEKLYISRDAGTTWVSVPDTTANPLTATSSAVYTFVKGVLSRTTDGGITWIAVAGPRVPVTPAIAVDEATGDIFQVVTVNTVVPAFSYVLRSVRGGPWERLSALPAGVLINTIVAAGGVVYIGTETRGTFILDFPTGRRRAVQR